jgi:alanyl-tRNA synthetase
MRSQEILEKYFDFYIERGHKKIPNVSLVPEGDSTLLFVNSGMFPLVPYLSGEQHPLGKRLVNVQRSLRLDDIDEVGDNRHTCVFHMIGNWSLGDYFKKDQLPWAYEFLIEHLKLDPKKLYATVFEGDEFAPKDIESIEIIKEIFKKHGIDAKEGERIFPCGRKNNWWQRGDTVGELGGPDSEIFYYIGEGKIADGKNLINNEEEFIEIGNSVFMQYKKTEKGWESLAQKNVDFGGGLERISLAVQKKMDIFETDSFWPIIEQIRKITRKDYYAGSETTRSMRILADHMRAAALLAMDGVMPGNKDQGYILRRILRRMIRAGRTLGIDKNISVQLVGNVVETLSWLYPELKNKQKEIENLFSAEEEKFGKTLFNGARELERKFSALKDKDDGTLAELAFNLFQSLGYPVEIFVGDMNDKGIKLDFKSFEKLVEKRFLEHQTLSRSGAEMKFKGGLADQSDTVVKYHTTTHLLQWALKNVLGDQVSQLGSNITNERLRFDFPHNKKLTEEEISKVEEIVNSAVAKNIPVNFVILPKEDAVRSGAVYMKHETYPDQVKVYFVGENIESAISKEFCGGPHVSNTGELKPIEIFKQESIGEGKMRIYARFK